MKSDPGSVGFRGLTSLILTAMALVAELLIAAVIAPERGMPGAARRS